MQFTLSPERVAHVWTPPAQAHQELGEQPG